MAKNSVSLRRKIASARSLLDLREEIDATDKALVTALNRRAKVVQRIWQLKKSLGMPMVDRSREQRVIDRAARLAQKPLSKSSVSQIMKVVLREGKKSARTKNRR